MDHNNNGSYGMMRLQDSFLSMFDAFGNDPVGSSIAYGYVAGAWNYISSYSDPRVLDLSFGSFSEVLDLIGGYVMERERMISRKGSADEMRYGIEDIIDTVKGYLLLTVFLQLDDNDREPKFILEKERICIRYYTESGSTGIYDPVEAVYDVLYSMELIRIGSMIKCHLDAEPLFAGLPYFAG